MDKLFKKGPGTDEVSGGGSPIYRYEDKENESWGSPRACGVCAEEVNARFQGLFPNQEEFVFHELSSDLVHTDVNIMRPDETHPYCVMYTTDMGDMPMTLPKEIRDREDLRYRELYMSLPKEWNPGEAGQIDDDTAQEEYWPIELIKHLARFPHEYSTWLGWGHTIPNGPGYEPLASGTEMGGVVLAQTDGDMGSVGARDGRKINFYIVIPVYGEGIEYKPEYDMEALDKRFSERNLSMVLDIHRPNLCADFKK